MARGTSVIFCALLAACSLSGCPAEDRVRREVATIARLSDRISENPGDVNALRELIGFAEADDLRRITRTNAIAQLGVVGEAHPSELAPSVVPVLAELVRSPDLFIRREAAQAIGSFGRHAESAVDDLLWVLADDRDVDAKYFAADALGKIAAKPEVTVPALIEFTSSASQFSPAGARALRAFGDAARSTLYRELAGVDEARRGAAAWALAGMGESADEVAQVTLELFESPTPAFRWMAVRATAEMLAQGKATEAIRRGLSEAANDPDERVRTEARDVLLLHERQG